MKKRLGQVSIEYLMITSLLTIVLIPTVYFFFSYSSQSTEEIDQQQLSSLATELTTTAETLYFLGPPSRRVIEERVPPGITGVRVLDDPNGQYVLEFTYLTRNGPQQIGYPLSVPLRTDFVYGDLREGVRQITLEAATDENGNTIAYATTRKPVRMFVTDLEWKGRDINGLEGANQKCMLAAQANNLEGEWIAWLSTTERSAIERVQGAKFIRMDGKPIAYGLTDLLDGAILNPIELGADGSDIATTTGNNRAWTGTPADGITVDTAENTRCGAGGKDDWKASGQGIYGLVDESGSKWTNDGTNACAPTGQSAHLYCLEQAELPEGTRPVVTTVNPTDLPSQGGAFLTIEGSNFLSNPLHPEVTFKVGDKAGLAYNLQVSPDGTSMTMNTPAIPVTIPGEKGSIVITNYDGSTTILVDAVRFWPPPLIAALTNKVPEYPGDIPAQGWSNGQGYASIGAYLIIDGDNFAPYTDVTVTFDPGLSGAKKTGTVLATSSATQLHVATPNWTDPSTFVDVPVEVKNPDGQTATAEHFFFVPPPLVTDVNYFGTLNQFNFGPTTSNGIVRSLEGDKFRGDLAKPRVIFHKSGLTSEANSTDVTFNSSTRIDIVVPDSPDGNIGWADIQVINPDGQAYTLQADPIQKIGFEYTSAPSITKIDPLFGPQWGTNTLTITGTNFRSNFKVYLIDQSATETDITSTVDYVQTDLLSNPQTIVLTMPSGSGIVDVKVENPDLQSDVFSSYVYREPIGYFNFEAFDGHEINPAPGMGTLVHSGSIQDVNAVNYQGTSSGRYGRGGVTISTAMDIELIDANRPFNHPSGYTQSIWIKPSKYNVNLFSHQLGSWPTVQLDSSGKLILGDDVTVQNFVSYTQVSTVFRPINNLVTIPLNEWTHLAFTYQGNAFKAYVNGHEIASTTLINSQATGARQEQTVLGSISNSYQVISGGGVNPSVPKPAFEGSFDEIRLYNKTLSAADVLQDTKSAVPIDTTIFYLDMEDSASPFSNHRYIGLGPASATYSPGVNDVLTFTPTQSLTQRYTVDFRVRLDASQTHTLFDSVCAGCNGWRIDATSDGRVQLLTGTTPTVALETPSSTLSVGNWHHVTIMRELTEIAPGNYQETAKIFVDDPTTPKVTSTAGVLPVVPNIRVGCRYEASACTSSTRLNGAMDEIAFYNAEMSDTDLNDLYNAQLWSPNGDGDSIADQRGTRYNVVSPGAGFELSPAEFDCDPSVNTYYEWQTLLADTDEDGYPTDSPQETCTGISIPPKFALALGPLGPDCAPTDDTKWHNRYLDGSVCSVSYDCVGNEPGYRDDKAKFIAFTTSTTSNGDIQGWNPGGQSPYQEVLTLCNNLAAQAGLPGTYVPWFSDGTYWPIGRVDGVPALPSLAQCNALPEEDQPSWHSLTSSKTPSVQIASSMDSLFNTKAILSRVDITENGVSVSGSNAWTNVLGSGVRATSVWNYFCDGWRHSAGQAQGSSQRGYYGTPNVVGGEEWTYVGYQRDYCDKQKRFICFQNSSVNWWFDKDGDGYGDPSTGVYSATAPAAQAGGTWRQKGADCYDGPGANANKAFPGQTQYFTTHRGDGSFDYNCDGVQEPIPTYNCVENIGNPGTCYSADIVVRHPGYVGAVPSCGQSAPFRIAELAQNPGSCAYPQIWAATLTQCTQTFDQNTVPKSNIYFVRTVNQQLACN